MSKIRNSLGLLVLTAPQEGDVLTWDQYKEQFGIDLHTIFEVDSVSKEVRIRPDVKKIFVVDFTLPFKGISESGIRLTLTPILYVNETSNTVDNIVTHTLYFGEYAQAFQLEISYKYDSTDVEPPQYLIATAEL